MSQYNQSKILVGSSYFFSGFEDFESKDKDYVIFEENPRLYNFYLQKHERDEDLFYWKIENVLKYNFDNNPMAIGKFLVPEILKSLDLKFKDVQILISEYILKLDKRHEYQKIIFDSYTKNKSMRLTKTQLEKAYSVYKENKNGK